jgi:DMSO/TMAO reductase YedYZ molybdopterin-dependent catalytic subunit
MTISRRHILVSGAAAFFPKTALRAGDGMITLSPQPLDVEMPLDDFVDEITPVKNFFIRSHTLIPEVKLTDWKLSVDGLVEKPVILNFNDLKQMPRMELVSVLECAGNGRGFYAPRVAGSQWSFGAVGNARWTGVRLRDVLDKCGLKARATEILLDGADVPLGKMPDFQRTIPVAKALDPDTILAYEMNGEPLTAAHGFPLRLIAPGWASDSWVKWLQHIEVLDHEFEGFWMKTAYRHPNRPVAPGAAVDPKDMVPVTDLNVKSVIAHPGEWAKPGRIAVAGVAWSNASPVTKVEVSTDAGSTWAVAKLLGEPAKYGFRKWSYGWDAREGRHTLLSRATNAKGESQPLEEQWNPSGYLWNVAQARPVLISRKEPAPAPVPEVLKVETPPGYASTCMGCHDEHMMQQQRLTRAQWDQEVNKMTNWGAPVKPDTREALLDYLSSRYEPRP